MIMSTKDTEFNKRVQQQQLLKRKRRQSKHEQESKTPTSSKVRVLLETSGDMLPTRLRCRKLTLAMTAVVSGETKTFQSTENGPTPNSVEKRKQSVIDYQPKTSFIQGGKCYTKNLSSQLKRVTESKPTNCISKISAMRML